MLAGRAQYNTCYAHDRLDCNEISFAAKHSRALADTGGPLPHPPDGDLRSTHRNARRNATVGPLLCGNRLRDKN
jgi:hypothetical protein